MATVVRSDEIIGTTYIVSSGRHVSERIVKFLIDSVYGFVEGSFTNSLGQHRAAFIGSFDTCPPRLGFDSTQTSPALERGDGPHDRIGR